jgi:peptidoglycan/xylan/chitin deacetylase (PgdA/CDA1 family)
MLAQGLDRMRRAARHFKGRIAPGALILLYHRVAAVDSDPWSLCVTPEHFREHLEILGRKYSSISLQRLNRALANHQSLSRSVVITFDDGYADNLHCAKPLLEQYDIPATVFVISGSVGSAREFWWDELERLILQPEVLPASVTLLIRGTRFEWTSSGLDKRREKSWPEGGALRRDGDAERQSLYHALWKRFRFLKEDERPELLDQLLEWSGGAVESRASHRQLSSAELIRLAEGGLVEIGSHTLTHPFLSKLSAISQDGELRQSRRSLEEIIGQRVTSFSYPHGDYGWKTATLAAEAGYTCACSSYANTVRTNTNHFQLPRIVVEDWDGEEFNRRLSEWLGS